RFAAVDHLARPGLARRPDRRMRRLAALFVEPGVAPARELEKTLKQLKFSNVEVRATLSLAAAAADQPWAATASPASPQRDHLLSEMAERRGDDPSASAGVTAARAPRWAASLALDGEQLRRA